MLQTPIYGMVNNSQQKRLHLDDVLAEERVKKASNAFPMLMQ